MKFDGLNDTAQMNSMLYHDNSALTNIKHSNEQGEALQTVAGQFEAMFLQMVLRQMRSSSDVLSDKDSPFSSKQYGVFRDMYDGQMAIEMARKQSSGIADMLVRQLSPSMREVEFDKQLTGLSANDAVTEVEEISQNLAVGGSEAGGVFHSGQESVASIKKVVNEVSLTPAFSQPLIQKMEL